MLASRATSDDSIQTESKRMEMLQPDISSLVANYPEEVAILTDTYTAPVPPQHNKTAKDYFNDFCRSVGNSIKTKCQKLCACFSGIFSARQAAPNPPLQAPVLPGKSSHSSKMRPIGGGSATFHVDTHKETKEINNSVPAQNSKRPMEIEMSVIDRSKPSLSTRI